MTEGNDTRIDLKMLLLGLFLLSVVFVTGRELTINNHIVKIEDGVLKKVEPIGESCTKLDLSGLGLVDIHHQAFVNSPNLTELNLANNSLTALSCIRLRPLVNLKNLSVANNSIASAVLCDLDNLDTYDLSNNQFLSLYGISDIGRGQCDFIVKGTRITSVVYGSFFSPDPARYAKPMIPVVTNMYTKCNTWWTFLRVEADGNENITLADKKIKCPKLQKPSSVTFDITHTLNTYARVEVCIENGTLQGLSSLPAGSAATENCKDISYLYRESKLDFSRMGIENFARGWFRVRSFPIHSIDLAYNNIARQTSNFLNDLPESVKHVRLSGNKIKRLDVEIIENQFLMYLDLSDNGLHEIQSNVLKKTNLSGLILSRNNFTDTRFVENLTSSLTELYLNENNISQVSANSFSKLNNLFYLDLSSNKITQLGRKSLQGLSSLQRLFLSRNYLQNIESGVFRDLGELRELDLGWNNMTEFKESVFSDLRELILLYINGNKVNKVTEDTFKGLPDTLRTLDLRNNSIESLEKGSFVRVPKYELNLGNNVISKIEIGGINISSLRDLYLSHNKLSEIKEENFDLPNLKNLGLDNNLIGKIEKGAFRNLGNMTVLWISRNPIKTLPKGSLFGIKRRGMVYTFDTNLELIQGGVFFDA